MKTYILHTIQIICIVCAISSLNAQTTIAQDSAPIAITNWLIAGPFDSPDVDMRTEWDATRQGYTTDFLKPIGGETNPKIRKGTSVKVPDGKKIKFKPYKWDSNYLDLSKVFDKNTNVCAYLYTELESDSEQLVTVHLGTNDAGKLWVDGQLVASHTGNRGAKPSQNTAQIKLLPGKRTTILMKIDQGGGGWGAYLEIYGLTAHQKFMESKYPKSLELRAVNNYLYEGELLEGLIEGFSINYFELKVPTKWTLQHGENRIPLEGNSDKIEFKIPNGLVGEMILLATKQVGNKSVEGKLQFTVRTKQEKTFNESEEALQIGNMLELFVDNYLIHKLADVEFKQHQPRDVGSVIRFDKPWEGAHTGYCTVIKDGETYKMYYRGTPESGSDGNAGEYTCYAESKDGIHWEKPNLGIYEIMNTRENNVILYNDVPLSHNFTPFLDTNPNALPYEKYKAFGGVEKSGLFGFTSKDGIHWNKIGTTPLFTKGAFDSQNVAFWSEKEQKYVLYFRTWTGPDYSGIRTIGRSTSKDFIHWSEPQRMEFGATPMEHLYTNQTSPYFRAPHIYVAIAARFMPGRQVISEEQAEALQVNPEYFRDCSDVVLMSSRGGNKYDRTFMEGFIKPGIGLQNWVSRSNYPALNVVQTGSKEMSLYVSHDNAQPTKHLRRYSMRLDGFASLNAPYSGGEMITKLLTFKGKELLLNFATSATGFIKVELLDEDGNKIPGFELENSIEIIGNEIEKTVTWEGNPDLEKLNGKSVRLRFVMKDVDLYSIRFK